MATLGNINRAGTFVVGAMALAVSFVPLMGEIASANTCSASTHSGCDGHSCPDDGNIHKHKTVHAFWRDHWCKSTPSTGALYFETGACDLTTDCTFDE